MDSGFHNQQPGFWITIIIMVGFWIPLAGFSMPKLWIPDSTDQNYLDSGLPYMGRIIANSASWLSIISYPMHACGIIIIADYCILEK